jgi:hypothetical protein
MGEFDAVSRAVKGMMMENAAYQWELSKSIQPAGVNLRMRFREWSILQRWV